MTLPRLLGLSHGLCLSLALLTACPGGSGTEDTKDTTNNESGESGENKGSCGPEGPCEVECAADLPALPCVAAEPCATLDLLGCTSGIHGLSGEDAVTLQCMVDALIVQDPGMLRMEHTDQTEFELIKLVIFDDGSVVEHENNEFNVDRNRYRAGPLRPPAYFEGCDAISDTCDKLSCIRDWIDEDACAASPTLPAECVP